MNYTLNQIRVFLKVAQLKSVTKASEALFLTQPAVSIQLKNFQDQFDIPLTEVVGRKIYITEFGKEIAQAAERILQEVEAINYKTMAYKGHLSGKLTISVVSTGKYVMPYFLSDFLKLHDGVELSLDVTNKSRVIDSLEANEVDFSLVSILPESLQLNHVDILENRLYLVCNKASEPKHPINTKKRFESLPLIFREEGSGTRQTMERFIEGHHLSVRKKMELTSNEAVKQAVLAGLGYSIMPLIGIINELKRGEMKIVPVKGLPIKTNWQMIWLKKKRLSPVAEAFLNFIEIKKNEIAHQHFDLDEFS